MKTPVVFLVFNRPDLTARVFAEIAKARPEKLLVVADGPRDSRDEKKCAQVREIVEHIDWDCNVLRNYSDINLGCRKRVSSGLDWVFDNVEQTIILEDDCLPHPTFFRYCEEQLDYFKDDNRVGHISGNNFQRGYKRSPYSYYFSRYNGIWGWATWRRAWHVYDADMSMWPEIRKAGGHYDLFPERKDAEWLEFFWDEVYARKIDTWDLQWMFSRLINGMLSVVPCVNLVSNIGFRSDATRTVNTADINANLPVEEMIFPLNRQPHVIVDEFLDKRVAGKFLCRETWLRNIGKLLANPHYYGALIRKMPILGRLWAWIRRKQVRMDK